MTSYPPQQLWYTWEDCGALCMARLLGWTGALVTQASLTSIAWRVYDVDLNKTLTGSGACVIADNVFDTAQTDGSWPYTDGYNFRHLLAATCFPTGGHKYRIEYVFTPSGADGETFAAVYDLVARDLYGS